MAEPVTPPEEMEAIIRDYALTFPESYVDHPWDETVVKVRKKIFLFYGIQEGAFYIGVKLPHSSQAALTLGWMEPMGYGLGKAGWVGGRVRPGQPAPLDLLKEWVEESYRAVAPKTLVAKLPSG